MKYSKFAWGIIALAAGIGLGACGGGGGGGTTSSGNQNITVGAITGFGSVYVNGCEYETTSTSISVDDNPSANEDNLKVGQVVKVTSSSACDPVTNKANATSIVYSDELEGVVDSNSVTGGIGSMVVMGQTVSVNDMTLFEDYTGSVASVDNIAAGNIVEISGHSNGTGTIVATRIEVKYLSLAAAPAGYEIEVKGLVSNLTASTFTIGNNPGLTVSYTTGVLDDSIGMLANDLFVEVKATTYGNPLVATKVELEDDDDVGHQSEHGAEIELRGFFIGYNASSREVTIGSTTFVINDETRIRDINGDEYATTADGEAALASATPGQDILKGNGKVNSAGDLIASEIRWEDSLTDNNECKGIVSDLVMPDDVNQPNVGTLTVNPDPSTKVADCEGLDFMSVTVDNSTIMHDSSAASVTKFNLSYLKDGETVEVHVDPSTGIATRLERK